MARQHDPLLPRCCRLRFTALPSQKRATEISPPSATISLSHGHAATAMSDRERRFLLVIEEGGLMREFPSSNSAGSTQKGRSHGNRETKWKSARRIGQLRKRS